MRQVVVEADIASFFDEVDSELLLGAPVERVVGVIDLKYGGGFDFLGFHQR